MLPYKNYIRVDASGRVINGSSVRRKQIPKNGRWLEIPSTLCCDLVEPPAPTGGTVDDTANTFSYTLATGYVVGDHERTLDGGATWGAATNPITGLTGARAIGSVGVRVKAAQGRSAGPAIYNTVAYTA